MAATLDITITGTDSNGLSRYTYNPGTTEADRIWGTFGPTHELKKVNFGFIAHEARKAEKEVRFLIKCEGPLFYTRLDIKLDYDKFRMDESAKAVNAK